MKPLLLAILLLFTACTSTPNEVITEKNTTPKTLTADFTPPTGAEDQKGTEGPWARRLLGATSEDGLTWTKTNHVITDQADVGDLAVDENGRLYLYYYGWTVGDRENVPAMAISDDNGQTWTFKNMIFSGFPNRGDVSDPNVVYDNGIFQLYGSTRTNEQTYLVHGESTDGITFTYKGIAFQPESGNAGVAAAYKTEDGWDLLSLASLGFKDDTEPGTIWHATSTDGDSFTLKDTFHFNQNDVPYFQGNVTPVEGGYRLYVFGEQNGTIRSYFSKDGDEWEMENGVRLSLDKNSDLESVYVGDPDIVQLKDGSYFMVYSTLIP